MREVDFRSVDLNLLVTLDVLLEERSVTRTAQRLGMSQPAASRALARLRSLFKDPLLVEGRAGYSVSARAEALRPTLRRTLQGVEEMLETRPFDPAAAAGRMRLVMADLEAAALAPHLMARLATEAPGLDLDVVPPGPALFEALERDAVDAVVGVIDAAPAGIRRRGLYEDGFVTLMRAGHPAAGGELTLERYLALRHIVVSITGAGAAPVDVALERLGRRRRVNVRVPSFLAAVEIAGSSDLVMTLPSSLARSAAGTGRFAARAPPVDLGRFTMSLAWHARHQDDPRHVWLRRTLVEVARRVSGAAPAL